MSTEEYGTDVRAWPSGDEWGASGGYFSDYRWVFAQRFDQVGRWHCLVHQDAAGFWWWEVGYFSWTPHGDLWDSNLGRCATRRFAENEARRMAETKNRRDERWEAERETERAMSRKVGPSR